MAKEVDIIHTASTPNSRRKVFLLIFIFGALIRSINIWQPLDGNIRESWREADVASIARNYCQEGMNIFYPRIDWRGDGPGYAEMEFPALPYLMALNYKVWGCHEIIGKILSYCCSLVGFYFFILLALYLLPELAAMAASVFFALNPLTFQTANTLQPESSMLMFYILAVYSFIRWMDDNSLKYYSIAIVSTASAILAKASAIHIGLFYLLMMYVDKKITFVKNMRVWAFAVLCLAPGFVWYRHAHTLWLRFGNSLGVSNESHWVGWDFFTNPYFIKGIIKTELLLVWIPTGLFIILFGLVKTKLNRVIKLCLIWLSAISLYYFLVARTAADGWAFYYHIVSVPPVAILFGNGFNAIFQQGMNFNPKRLLLLSSLLAVMIILFGLTGLQEYVNPFSTMLLLAISGIVCFSSLQSLKIKNSPRSNPRNMPWAKYVLAVMLYLIPTTFFVMAYQIVARIHSLDYDRLQTLHEFAKEIEGIIPKDTLIISSGGRCTDRDGYPVAYNASYMFYWLNRKGFSICEEEQNIETVQTLIKRGARFYLVEKSSLERKPGFLNALSDQFQLLNECSEAYLFHLLPFKANVSLNPPEKFRSLPLSGK